MALKEALERKIDEWRPRTARLIKEYGGVKVSEIGRASCRERV